MKTVFTVEMIDDLTNQHGLDITSEIEKELVKEIIRSLRKDKIKKICNII